MRIAVIGLGEAGAIYATAAVRQGWDVAGFDPFDVPTPDGVERAATLAEAVDGATLVLGLTGAKAARAIASDLAPLMGAAAVLADMNSGSARFKREVARALDGVAVADVAVMGSVPAYGARTPLIVSGAGSSVAAEAFRELGAAVEDLGGEPGEAATRKLVRSGWMKGLGALIVETVEAGEAAGLGDWARAQIAAELADGEASAERLHASTLKHAARRSREMADATAQLEDLGVLPIMSRATTALHEQLAENQALVTSEVLEAWAGLPVANIGDARERLGITTGLVAPWPGAHLVGRARTVQVAGGDNVGIQRIIDEARPGDVIVVDGQADVARALVGELIAGRLQAKGVRGMVIDGAVRDAEDLQEMGFPIWARGRSAAGPYKNGPFRHGVPVAIGGVVCMEGDLVVADGDGVTFVRPSEAPALLAAGRAVQEEEARRRRGIEADVAAYRAAHGTGAA